MVRGEQWRHRQTHAVVRIEVYEHGFVSFSLLRGNRWFMCPTLWDEEEFKAKHERIGAHGTLQ